MNRRNFLKTSAAITVAASLPLAGCTPTVKSERLNVDTMITHLESLKALPSLEFEGPWPAFATFTHLAQSIEYAMVGFPEHKSDSFKTWLGGPVFWVFKQAGSMRHDTAEAIPGAPELDIENTDPVAVNQSIDRLIVALREFDGVTETKPHFAYGELSHEDYMLAQLMHINDHLDLLPE